MTIDTGTIDQRLRAKAQKELKEEVDGAIRPVLNLLLSCGSTFTLNVEKDGNVTKRQGYEVLAMLRAFLVEAMTPTYEQKALDAFLAKVDSLQDQLDEVRNLTGV